MVKSNNQPNSLNSSHIGLSVQEILNGLRNSKIPDKLSTKAFVSEKASKTGTSKLDATIKNTERKVQSKVNVIKPKNVSFSDKNEHNEQSKVNTKK